MTLWSNTARPKWVNAANGQIHNIFPTSEGWVLRHDKANGRYWDETLATQASLLEASAANITAVAFTANQNYATLTIASGVGNAFTYVHNTRPFGNVFQMSNSTTYTCNAEIISTSNVVPYVQLAIDTSNIAAFPNAGNVVFQTDGVANTATGVLFLANSTVLRVRNVTGTFNTDEPIQANSTINAAVTAVTSNVTGTLIVKRLAGRFGTSNVIQNGYSNLTVSAANNWANGVVSVFFDEKVTVSGGTPSLNISTADTTNAVCTFASGNNTNKLNFTFTANGDAAATFRILGQQIALNSATIKDQANSSVTSNTLFANAVVANVQFGVAGANISV